MVLKSKGNGKIFMDGEVVIKRGSTWRQLQEWSANNEPWWIVGQPVVAPSDMRLKTELCPIDNALEKVLQLKGTRYRWSEAGLRHLTASVSSVVSAGPDATEADQAALRSAEREKACQALSGRQIGLIAQELEAVVPELVQEDQEGYKHIRYQQLTALLVEAVKAQHALVQSLSGRLAALEAR